MSMIPLLVASIKDLITVISDLQSYRNNLSAGIVSYDPTDITQNPTPPAPPPSLPGV